MTFWIVTWVALVCPGGMLKGLIPSSLKPIVCDSTPTSQVYQKEILALERLADQGPRTSIQICNQTGDLIKCNQIPIQWEPVLKQENHAN